jgi:hypothetical protein
MINKIILGLVVMFSLGLVIFTQPALASDVKISPNNITDRGGVDPGVKSDSVVASILSGVYQISAIVAVLVLVIAGIRYITSDGDPSRAQAARKGIIYSLIGLVIIGSAFIITGVVIGLF